MEDNNSDLKAQLKELQQDYLNELPQRFREISSLWEQLQENWQFESVADLYGILHKLAGSGASFGYIELSDEARRAGELLLPFKKSDSHAPGPKILHEFNEHLTKIFASISLEADLTSDSYFLSDSKKLNSDSPLVYLLEDDENLAHSLALQLQSYGYKTHYFFTIDDFKKAIKRKIPNLVIMNMMLQEGEFAGTHFIQELKNSSDFSIPIVVFSSRTDFDARLDAVKAGAAAYFAKPVETDHLVTTLDKLTLMGEAREPLRILIIDDDEQLASHYALALAEGGLETSYITRPETVCQAISDFMPDLVITDLYMPGCSGVELASIIRQHSQFTHIPIVFISTESQLDKQLDALKMGGDDFLTKPIDDDHLLECIKTRALRARSISELMMQDSLTGLLKHAVIKENLKSELSRAARTNSPLTFVMLDIDKFKEVNDTYGHLNGDRVLKCLARMLSTHLRKSDSVGRYGGEEFAIILPECNSNQAKEIIDKIRKSFALTQFNNGNGGFSVTFSAGVAQFPIMSSSEELIRAADEALYRAKEFGRNRIEIY